MHASEVSTALRGAAGAPRTEERSGRRCTIMGCNDGQISQARESEV